MSRLWPGDVPPWERDAALASEPAHRPLPFLALVFVFATALAAWFPYADTAYWKSDDFLAVAYASDPARAATDLYGNQYGLDGLVWFYRPLITLSFALDYAIGGIDPFVSHLSNALAHALSSVFVLLLASRFVGGATAILVTLVWSLAPANAGSILWAVGRVDSHTSVWILASTLAVVRAIEGRPGARFWAFLACVLALLSKEHAIVVPGIAAILGLALGAGGSRLRTAWRVTWPLGLTLGVYLAWRFALFGRLGGYGADATPGIGALVGGFGVATMRWLNPLEYSGSAVLELPEHVWLIGFAPIALAILIGLAKLRFGAIVTLFAVYVVACVPLFQLLPHTGNLVNLRYLYLPGVALAGLLAIGGWLPALLALGVWALPFLELREDWATASRDVAARHARILDVAKSIPDDPLLVADLAPHNAKGTVLELHVGVDRLARPPFARAADARTI
ncbi:MAG: hypothetical protein KDB80_13445, partial [Planctomycetes bacterium]|nr:hypothetical protein [Planctomycetota bacterium]